MENKISKEVFFGPYFLLIVSAIFLLNGTVSLFRKKTLIPPRGIDAKWMGKKWTLIWAILQIVGGLLFLYIYFNRAATI